MTQPGRPPSRVGTQALTQQSSSNTPNPSRPITRSSNLPIAEIINNPDEEIRSAEAGRKFLDKHQYTIPGEPVTFEHVSHALFYISQMKGVTPLVRSTVRSAAYLVQDMVASTAAQTIVEDVTSKLETSLIAAISPQIAKILTAAETFDKLSTKIDESADKITKNAECVPHQPVLTDHDSVDTCLQALTADTTTIKEAIDDLKMLTKAVQPPTPSPYREALLSQNHDTPTSQNNIPVSIARAHAAVKERQILLDPDHDHPQINNNTSKDSMIDMLKQAITSVETIDSPQIQIKSLARLRNQGILLELNSSEAATWVKNPLNRLIFIEQLGGKIKIKDRQFNLVVPFLPISTDISDPATLRYIEHENGIPEYAITQARWIKDPTKCDDNQRVAHALFSFSSPEAANKLLKDGLYVNMERLRPHKDKKEPIRCLKCQWLGHMAKDCTQEKDTCSKCAGEHRFTQCSTPDTLFCVNCQSNNHSSADRHCPQFIKRRAALDERTPENNMPYFPTEEAWTQALAPPKPSTPLIQTRLPPGQPRPQTQPHLRQTTLGEGMTIRNTGHGQGQGRGRGRRPHGGRGGPPVHNYGPPLADYMPPPPAPPAGTIANPATTTDNHHHPTNPPYE